MTRKATSAIAVPPAAPPDPFRFGWRYVRRPGANGAEESVRVPLTLDDVLHPRERDHIPVRTIQQRDRTYLFDVLLLRQAELPSFKVFSDCLIDWGVAGLRNHSPDISGFEDVVNRDRDWTTFHVVEEGARPLLVIEIVSPDAHDRQARDNDVVTKVKEYHRADVPVYVIVDQEKENGPRQLIGYRRGKRGYVRVAAAADGRLLLESVGLWLALRDKRVVCFDAATGAEIPDMPGMVRARQEAEQARAAEAQARQQAEAALAAAQARIAELEAQGRPRRRPRGRD